MPHNLVNDGGYYKAKSVDKLIKELEQRWPDAIRMFQAIQTLRNLDLLHDLHELRSTRAYDELCNAWKEFDDLTECQHRIIIPPKGVSDE